MRSVRTYAFHILAHQLDIRVRQADGEGVSWEADVEDVDEKVDPDKVLHVQAQELPV